MSAAKPPPPGMDIPAHYANWISPRGNLYDLALDFGYVLEAGDPPHVDWCARVVVSWEEAVTLHEMLADQIATYEEQVGEIRRWGESPPNLDPDSNGSPGDEDED